jgi:ergothioneine biosynthesis protein EgtB
MSKLSLFDLFKATRLQSEKICQPLATEDYVVQPVVDVSPPKWHLAHTTWFFEEFVLDACVSGYKRFHPSYAFIFNSYYESVGNRVMRTDRGNLSRPSVQDVYEYREYVTNAMLEFLASDAHLEVKETIEIGIHHEKQHQELLITDIKYILGHNPLWPAYDKDFHETPELSTENGQLSVEEGVYEIGYDGEGFCYDNEKGKHRVYLEAFKISRQLVSNAEWLEFMNADAYQNALIWHTEGWDWVKKNNISSPMYWHKMDGEWKRYSLAGLEPIKLKDPVTHISFYEAAAFAEWSGKRLPTEQQWEVACKSLDHGQRWEWTESAYLPYPGFTKPPGALGEYNGKFMVNQKVLRGGSVATPANHLRPTYRNFFHPHLRWQFTGLRLTE